MKKVKEKKVSEFLTVRNDRFKPSEAGNLGLKRIDKIDFSGNIYLSDKPTNTDMILARKGDLVISGINAAKGALAIYHGEEDVLATIHYSSYQFDEKKINIDYLQNFVKSPVFQHTLKLQVKGGMKTELKPKHILNLEIPLPSLTEQETIVQKIKGFMATHSQSKTKIEALQTDLKAYRKSILQEAIKGNLTAEWRANNPTEKIDIKTLKKETTKKQKPLAAIKADEMPFSLPKNWSWVRLGEICDFITKGTTPNTNKITPNGEIPYLKVYNIVNQKLNFHYKPQFIDKYTHEKELTRSIVYPDDILMNIVGPPLGKVAIVTNDFPEWNINQALAIFRPVEIRINKFLYHYLCEGSEIRKLQPLGVVGQDNISLEQCRNLLFPLPPLTEQAEIVGVLEEKMATITAAEEQLKALLAEQSQLQKSMMQEVFRG
jgi:type I restriction enzyme S subunit